jgi:hypothetical protein
MIAKRQSSYHLGHQKDFGSERHLLSSNVEGSNSQDDQTTALATTRMSTQNTTILPEDKTSIQPKVRFFSWLLLSHQYNVVFTKNQSALSSASS